MKIHILSGKDKTVKYLGDGNYRVVTEDGFRTVVNLSEFKVIKEKLYENN